MDNSSGVLEIDTKRPVPDHTGRSAPGSKRQIAYRSGKTVNVRSALGLIATNPFLRRRRRVTRQRFEQTMGIGFFDHKPAICRPQKALFNSTVEQHQKRVVITVDV